MNTSEKYIERKLGERIKALGGMYIKLTTEYGHIGLPDRLCVLPSKIIVFVELKSKGQKPRKIQENMHTKLRNLGFDVFVIDSIEKINTVINFIKEKNEQN